MVLIKNFRKSTVDILCQKTQHYKYTGWHLIKIYLLLIDRYFYCCNSIDVILADNNNMS